MDKKEKIRLIENIIANISAAMISYKMYGEEHKLVQQSIDLIVRLLGEVLIESGREGITVGIIGDEIAFEKEPLYDISDRAKNFIDGIKQTGHSKITFTEGIDKNEILSLMEVFSLKKEYLKEKDRLKEILKEKSITHIVFGNIGLALEREEINGVNEDSVIVTKNSFDLGVDFLKETIESLEKGEPLSPKSARQIVSGITGSLLKNKSLLLILTSTKSHDESTFVHDVNVCIFTILQAEVLGIDKKYWSEIGAAALLHDVGKLSVSGDILRKKGKLTEEEREKISVHPAQGAKILLETEGINILPAVVAFEHHMAYDKTGYPKRLYGKTLNLISMMVTIADYYDAVRSERSYHKGSKPEDTYEDMIKLSGKLDSTIIFFQTGCSTTGLSINFTPSDFIIFYLTIN